jgi:uncharacterized phage-associated protein
MTHKDIQYKFDKEKSVAVMLFILNKLHQTDLHKLFKIIYFADIDHLIKTGKPITGDWYVAMKDGPVPSNIYDLIKIIRRDVDFRDIDLEKKFKITGRAVVSPREEPDMDELTKFNLECINRSIEENKGLSYDKLILKSHDQAYDKADKNNKISFVDMVKVYGGNEELLKYIIATAENQKLPSRMNRTMR